MATNFRAMPIYVGAKKVKEIEECSIKFMSNGEQQIGFDEVLGESTGVVTSEGSFSSVLPVQGMEIDIDDLVINQTYVNIGLLKGGKTYKIVDAKIVEGETKSTSKSGVQKGSYTFRGGKPQVI